MVFHSSSCFPRSIYLRLSDRIMLPTTESDANEPSLRDCTACDFAIFFFFVNKSLILYFILRECLDNVFFSSPSLEVFIFYNSLPAFVHGVLTIASCWRACRIELSENWKTSTKRRDMCAWSAMNISFCSSTICSETRVRNVSWRDGTEKLRLLRWNFRMKAIRVSSYQALVLLFCSTMPNRGGYRATMLYRWRFHNKRRWNMSRRWCLSNFYLHQNRICLIFAKNTEQKKINNFLLTQAKWLHRSLRWG